jgi:hypothetical protein
MANATIYANPVTFLSWDPTSGVTSLTETSSTSVTNSSGVPVHWTEGTSSGTLKIGKTMNCTQGPVNRTWDFSTQSSGGPQITLTVSSSGGGKAPQRATPQGQEHGHGHGKGGSKKD